MDITKTLNTNHVILDMRVTNRVEVIKELTNFPKKDGATDRRGTFIGDVRQREVEGSTNSEDHITIPHDKSPVVINTTLAIGCIRQDIPWETLNGSSVRCIISSAVRPEDQNTTHTRLPSQVADTLMDDNIIEQLLAEMNPQKIADLSSQYAQSDVSQIIGSMS